MSDVRSAEAEGSTVRQGPLRPTTDGHRWFGYRELETDATVALSGRRESNVSLLTPKARKSDGT
jgi:hypothetical protein